MGNRERAEQRANELDAEIIETLRQGKNFRVEAGAGAGKTYSLMKVIEWLEKEKRKEFSKYGQQVACITYTNAAVDVIKGRLKSENFIRPCTIHNFAWGLMNRFQVSLMNAIDELGILPIHEDGSPYKIDEIKKITYELGVRYVQDEVLYIHHEDVIKLFVKMLDNAKFRMLLAKRYPIILIDEYQDSFRVIMDQFLNYFINSDNRPQIGMFGDSWQTIYSSMGACGEVSSDHIVVINKEANFRSQEVIVNVLNRIRPKLPQMTAIDDNDGRVLVITTDDYHGFRRTGYYKGELPESELFTRIDGVRRKLRDLGWVENHKTLMLTHKMLAKEQHYDHILAVLGEHLHNEDDEHYMFLKSRVEPIYHALADNNPKLLFEALGVKRRPIESLGHKRQWKELYARLKEARDKAIIDVIETVENSGLVSIPDKVSYWLGVFRHGDREPLFHQAAIQEFYNIEYKEILNAIEFQKPEAEFSTDHGVKGEEYESVLLVMGRGWNNYKFDEVIYKDPRFLLGEERDTYIRNRNLFYVCCSRAKKNFALFITVPVSESFRIYLERVFGSDSIMDYSTFMGL